MGKFKELTPDEKKWLLDDAYYSRRIDQSLEKVGLSRREFAQYMRSDAQFATEYGEALIDSCPFLENDMLNLHKTPGITHKMAAVMLNAIAKILAFRNPGKYGPKLDVNMNQAISIKLNLENANARIAEIVQQRVVNETAPLVLLNENASHKDKK